MFDFFDLENLLPKIGKKIKVEEAQKNFVPSEIFLPVLNKFGTPKLEVCENETVLKGQTLISYKSGFRVCAGISGKISLAKNKINQFGERYEAIKITNDFQNTEINFEPLKDFSLENICERLFLCGNVDFENDCVPLAERLKNTKIKTLVVNATATEPYLKVKEILLKNYLNEIFCASLKLYELFEVEKLIFVLGTEVRKFKKELLKLCKAEKNKKIKVKIFRSAYYHSDKDFVVKSVCSKKEINFARSVDVVTIWSFYEAIFKGKPFVERFVTVSGTGINLPQVVKIPLGSTVKEITDFCGGIKTEAIKLVLGGPMTGISQYSTEISIFAENSAILLLTEKETLWRKAEPCIWCALCVEVCPENLLPSKLSALIEANEFDLAKDYDLMKCTECGNCAYICPSKIDLVHYLHFGKVTANKN
ncbi:4Fe-4S dicluster domain-containing protein [bacterium]|nr:4Fe-4S dicluster domain-containing protein [bacterium]